jgi:hypothetical protein
VINVTRQGSDSIWKFQKTFEVRSEEYSFVLANSEVLVAKYSKNWKPVVEEQQPGRASKLANSVRHMKIC